jgi:hypothetical protein
MPNPGRDGFAAMVQLKGSDLFLTAGFPSEIETQRLRECPRNLSLRA